MADGEDRAVIPLPDDPQKLRAELLKQTRYGHFATVAKMEESPDRVFNSTYEGEKVRFRKWNQGQVGWLFNLPFYEKIATGQELDDKEAVAFDTIKADMVKAALLEPNRWAERLQEPDFVNGMFFVIQAISGLDESYSKKLDEFFNSDLGKVYGNVWFGVMRMTPQEVGKLNPASYNAVMTWAVKWAQENTKT